MDVALFLPTLEGGGAEKTMLRLAGAFAGSGLRVDVIVARAEGALLRQLPDGVRLIDLHARRMIAGVLPLASYLRRHQPQALLSTLELANLVAVLARWISGRPVRTIIRVPGMLSEYDQSTLKKKIERRLIAMACAWADGMVAVSQAVANDLAMNAGMGMDRIAVIYNPVISPELKEKACQPVAHPFFQPGQPPVILGAGRLVEVKDFTTLIRAFAIVREHQPARLVILGNGEQRQGLENLIEQMGLKADVSLPGFVDNPLAYMSKASVFVLPSIRETFGNVIIEAMACGCPVVCSDCPGGVAEVHAYGKYAAMTPVKDPEEMAKTILRFLAGERPQVDPGWLEKFTLQESANRYLSLLGFTPEEPFGNTGEGKPSAYARRAES